MVDAEWVFVNIVGNIGVALIIIAYFALTLKKMQSDSILYSALNLLGAVLIGVSLIFDFNLPAAVIESCWILISSVGIIKALFQKFRRKQHTPTGSALSAEESFHPSVSRQLSATDAHPPQEGVPRSTTESEEGAVLSSIA